MPAGDHRSPLHPLSYTVPRRGELRSPVLLSVRATTGHPHSSCSYTVPRRRELCSPVLLSVRATTGRPHSSCSYTTPCRGELRSPVLLSVRATTGRPYVPFPAPLPVGVSCARPSSSLCGRPQVVPTAPVPTPLPVGASCARPQNDPRPFPTSQEQMDNQTEAQRRRVRFGEERRRGEQESSPEWAGICGSAVLCDEACFARLRATTVAPTAPVPTPLPVGASCARPSSSLCAPVGASCARPQNDPNCSPRPKNKWITKPKPSAGGFGLERSGDGANKNPHPNGRGFAEAQSSATRRASHACGRPQSPPQLLFLHHSL